MIAAVDEFIFFDDMQYTRRDWRNRNQIKTPQGLQWLTVPVKVKGNYHVSIREIEIQGSDWSQAHWRSLVANYSRAPHFGSIATWLEPLYLDARYERLTELNQTLLRRVADYLGIETRFSQSSDYQLIEGKTERLVDLCRQAGGTEYISGPSARDYIDPQVFEANDIKLTWFDYAGYPEYPQLWGDFVHGVTILDLLFNCGDRAREYLRYVR